MENGSESGGPNSRAVIDLNITVQVDFLQQGDLQTVRDHKILDQVAGMITTWDDVTTLGLSLVCDPNDLARLQSENISIKGAAYKILRSFYSRNVNPDTVIWNTIKDAMRQLGKEAAVASIDFPMA